jgi:hypothetical protein
LSSRSAPTISAPTSSNLLQEQGYHEVSVSFSVDGVVYRSHAFAGWLRGRTQITIDDDYASERWLARRQSHHSLPARESLV